jgi:hypothetical protein
MKEVWHMSPFVDVVVLILTILFAGISLVPFVDRLPEVPDVIKVDHAKHSQTDKHEIPV